MQSISLAISLHKQKLISNNFKYALHISLIYTLCKRFTIRVCSTINR